MFELNSKTKILNCQYNELDSTKILVNPELQTKSDLAITEKDI